MDLKKFNCMGYAFGTENMLEPRGAFNSSEWIEENYDEDNDD